MRKRFNGSLVVEKSALFGFDRPRFGIAVAVEDNALMLLDGLADEGIECFCKVLCAFQLIGKLL